MLTSWRAGRLIMTTSRELGVYRMSGVRTSDRDQGFPPWENIGNMLKGQNSPRFTATVSTYTTRTAESVFLAFFVADVPFIETGVCRLPLSLCQSAISGATHQITGEPFG